MYEYPEDDPGYIVDSRKDRRGIGPARIFIRHVCWMS